MSQAKAPTVSPAKIVKNKYLTRAGNPRPRLQESHENDDDDDDDDDGDDGDDGDVPP